MYSEIVLTRGRWAELLERQNAHDESKSFKLGRDAETGEFVPVEVARRAPDHYVVEHVPKRGYGTEDR